LLNNNKFIEILDLWKIYKVGNIEYVGLKEVSLSISKGEFIALVGPSGSGKTTLLNLLGTLDRPTKGEIILDGISLSKLDDNALAEIRNKKIGFVFQTFNLIPYLPVIENVEIPMIVAGLPTKNRRKIAEDILTQLGLGDKLNKKPNQLSGGEQQRVAIARALVNNPSIILADEPTGNLDTTNAQMVVQLLKNICESKEVTIVMATHNLDLTKYCDRIIYLKDGYIYKEVRKN